MAPFLVIYLHGAGSHQDQGFKSGIYENFVGPGGSAWPAVVYVCLEYRGDSWMGPASETDMMELLRVLQGRYRPRATVLTGASMGGTSALIFASRHPDTLTGVVALSAATDTGEIYAAFGPALYASYGAEGGQTAQVPQVYFDRSSRYHADQLARLPVFIAHGSADTTIPVSHARLLVEQLQARGARFQYIEIPGGDHDSWLRLDLHAAPAFVQ